MQSLSHKVYKMPTKVFARHYSLTPVNMSHILSVCVIVCLLQNALCQVMMNNCGQPSQGINLGNLGGLTIGNTGSGMVANPGLKLAGAPNLVIGNMPNNCNNVVQGTSQQIGYGDVAIVGEVPVAGPTAVCGNVPVIGYVVFEGDVPAGGLVSVVDPCGCQCN